MSLEDPTIFSKIKLLVLDVDGVLTDGKITIDELGRETRSFDVKDGLGIRLLMETGIEVAVISAKFAKAVEYRTESLGIRNVHLGITDKASVIEEIMREKKLQKEEVCCMGDDIQDLPMLIKTGIPVAVADASPEVKAFSIVETSRVGGHGAVREVCEMIMKAQGNWPDAVNQYTD